MTDMASQFDEVVEVFGRLGMDVRAERLGGGGGGPCVLRGKPVLFIDLDADVATRMERCLAALAALPEVDGLYLTPALREEIDRRRQDG